MQTWFVHVHAISIAFLQQNVVLSLVSKFKEYIYTSVLYTVITAVLRVCY